MPKAIDERNRGKSREMVLFFKAASKNGSSMRRLRKIKNLEKKLLTKQITCDNINELLLSGNSTLTNKQQCNPERFLINEMKGHLIWKKFREQNLNSKNGKN